MTLAYRTGFTNQIIDSEQLLIDKPDYKFDKFQEYYDAIPFLFDQFYQPDLEVKKELARIAIVALEQMSTRDRENLLKIGIRGKKGLTLDDILPELLQIALA